MNRLQFVLLASLCIVCLSYGAFISPRPETELYLIRLRIELLTRQLHDACPHLVDHGLFLGKRDINTHQNTMEVERAIYDHILELLQQCNGETDLQEYGHATEIEHISKTTKTAQTSKVTTMTIESNTKPTTTAQTTTTPATTTVPTTPTTMKPTTTTQITTTASTTSQPLPSQCISSSTRTLSERWRNSSPDTNPRNSDLGDIDGGRIWFRFTGEAGNLLKNTCPHQLSCGSDGAFWSNSTLPGRIGETVSITFYESYWQESDHINECSTRGASFSGRATRCSMERGGVVYKMDDDLSSSGDTMCGMD